MARGIRRRSILSRSLLAFYLMQRADFQIHAGILSKYNSLNLYLLSTGSRSLREYAISNKEKGKKRQGAALSNLY